MSNFTCENCKFTTNNNGIVIINLTKQEMDAFNLLQNHFIQNDCEFCFIGETETVEEDTSYVGNLIKNESVKHFCSHKSHALGYKNYSNLSNKLKAAVNMMNNLKIRGPVPNENNKITNMLHIVGGITPQVSNDLIKNNYGETVVLKYQNQIAVIRIFYTISFESSDDPCSIKPNTDQFNNLPYGQQVNNLVYRGQGFCPDENPSIADLQPTILISGNM